MDREVARRGIPAFGLRYSNVYGPGEAHKGKMKSYLRQMIDQLATGDVRLFEDGSQRRDWVYVDDVVQANVRAAEGDAVGVLNVGSGRTHTFLEVKEQIELCLGVERAVILRPTLPGTLSGFQRT